MEKIKTDVVVVGTGAAGLYHALHLPKELQICMITKDEVDRSDSFLAQGGMCMLRDEEDYDGYFEDTMRAGHYENDPKSVEIMIRSSRQIAKELLGYGVDFERDDNGLVFTREGGHGSASCFMKTLPARRSPALCWKGPENAVILRS